MSTGIGVGIAGQVFQTKAGAGIAPDPSYSNLYSVLFDGIDESLDVTGSPDLGTGDFTVNFWLYRTSTSGNQRLLTKFSGTGSQWQIYVTNGNNLQWQSAEWNDASGVGLVSTTDVWEMWSYTADRSITTGTWYKNGANPNAKPSITTGDFGVGNFQVGRNGSDYNFAGNLDEISIWDAALTEAQLLGLYNSGAPTDLSKEAFESNLTTWWRMGDPSGQASYPTIADSKGSLDLTMTNMVAANITTNVPT